jgi:hypothetical protein
MMPPAITAIVIGYIYDCFKLLGPFPKRKKLPSACRVFSQDIPIHCTGVYFIILAYTYMERAPGSKRTGGNKNIDPAPHANNRITNRIQVEGEGMLLSNFLLLFYGPRIKATAGSKSSR